MIEVGQCIEVDLLKNGKKETYFRTDDIDTRYGVDYYTFCRVSPKMFMQGGVDFTDLWGVSEKYFQELLKNGQIKILTDENGHLA